MTTPVSHDKTRHLDGAEKVAVALLALEREASNRVLKYFNESELRRLARVAAQLGAVPAAALEEICAALAEEIAVGDVDIVGGPTQTEGLLAEVLPDEELAEIMSDIRGSSNRFLWNRLASLPESALADYLANERPQTIAVVIGKLDSGAAARILAQLPGGLRAQALRRMLIAKPIAETVLRAVEEMLQQDLLVGGGAPSSSGVSARVASIVNQLEREQVEEILFGIEQAEPVLAAQLRGLLFSFEDIPSLGQRARMVVFDQAATDRVIMALRGADAETREAVLPCLSARTRRMVEAELAAAGEASRRDVLAAQREIASLVLRLADQGLIELPRK